MHQRPVCVSRGWGALLLDVVSDMNGAFYFARVHLACFLFSSATSLKHQLTACIMYYLRLLPALCSAYFILFIVQHKERLVITNISEVFTYVLLETRAKA